MVAAFSWASQVSAGLATLGPSGHVVRVSTLRSSAGSMAQVSWTCRDRLWPAASRPFSRPPGLRLAARVLAWAVEQTAVPGVAVKGTSMSGQIQETSTGLSRPFEPWAAGM
jgi:hypothetical protein